MTIFRKPLSLYAAFDRYPSCKGAAIHIERFAGSLFDTVGCGLLYVLGDPDTPAFQQEANSQIVRFTDDVPNFLERTLAFGKQLHSIVGTYGENLKICHFRDPWSGVAILSQPNRRFVSVYEVNGLPSVELVHHYPLLAPSTRDKIAAVESFCLHNADQIVVPSHTIKHCLIARGVAQNKITVIPNGADIAAKRQKPPGAPDRYLIYFGGLQNWQGVDVLFKAFSYLQDFSDLHLVMCVSNRSRLVKHYQKLADKLEISAKIIWHYELDQEELAKWRDNALISVAPLKDCARNIEQGCCPLKILESMAAAIPVVSSTMPAVKEIIDNDVDGKLVYPDRPSELARSVRILLEYPELRVKLGNNARKKIKKEFSWEDSLGQLSDLYRGLLTSASWEAVFRDTETLS